MLHGVFRTKEAKIVTAIIGLFAITILIFVITRKENDKQFLEQAVLAENYLVAGNYDKAVEAFQKAISMKKGDEEQLYMGLADAYVGMENYDKALEVLRIYYQKSAELIIKEKIEEVTSEKTEFEFNKAINRAEIYFTNQEYDKAIAEYEKAKTIKSKDAVSYRQIAKAYMEKGEYILARDEVLEGQALTKDESLDELLIEIEAHMIKAQYDILVAQAEEYIYQENYEDGIGKYKEAINLLSTESAAYIGLSQAYIALENYDEAVLVLKAATNLQSNPELEELLNQAVKLKDKTDEINNLLSVLFKNMKARDMAAVTAVLDTSVFKDNIKLTEPLYYYNDEDKKQVMIIYDQEQIYFGDFRDGIRKGEGILYVKGKDQTVDYYYYDGEWRNDMPNGKGKTEEVTTTKKDVNKTVTVGSFSNAAENGSMNKYFYLNDKETGRVNYTSKDGKPLPMKEDASMPTPKPKEYIIGRIYLGDQATDDYYSVKDKTIWGVKPLL